MEPECGAHHLLLTYPSLMMMIEGRIEATNRCNICWSASAIIIAVRGTRGMEKVDGRPWGCGTGRTSLRRRAAAP